MFNAHQFPKVRGAMEIALFIQNIQEERAEVATCFHLPIFISLRQVALYIFSRNQSNSEIAAVDQSDKNRCVFFFFNLCTKRARVVAGIAQLSSHSLKLNALMKEKVFDVHTIIIDYCWYALATCCFCPPCIESK